MIRHKRVAHVMGVEEEAVKLAKFWGADPELARHAGILHDCTKYLELTSQLHLCAKYGIELDALEQKAVKLLPCTLMIVLICTCKMRENACHIQGFHL